MQSGFGNDVIRKVEEGSEIGKQSIDNNIEEDNKNIIDLISEFEVEISEGEVERRQLVLKLKEVLFMKRNVEFDMLYEFF